MPTRHLDQFTGKKNNRLVSQNQTIGRGDECSGRVVLEGKFPQVGRLQILVNLCAIFIVQVTAQRFLFPKQTFLI